MLINAHQTFKLKPPDLIEKYWTRNWIFLNIFFGFK